MRRNWRWQCLRRAYNGLGKFLSARIAEEAAFVVIHSSYRGELSFGKLSAPLAVLINGLTFSGCLATSQPITFADPEEGKSKVESIRITVVLPAPLGPTRATDSPSATKISLTTPVKPFGCT